MVGKADGTAGVGELKLMVHEVLPDAWHAQMETLLLTVPPAEDNTQYYLLLLEIKTSLIESEFQVSQHLFFFASGLAGGHRGSRWPWQVL